ncbi:glycoside hydrolase superfamily [Dichotomocladium elegans]|nr:glycoside hydrolase superfamily [Dichotomocladium elegans]
MKAKMPQYEYINLDSGWSDTCDRYGRWTYRQDLFPSGLKALADHCAKNGQKLGVYILPGIRQDAAEANLPIRGVSVCRLGDLCKQKKEGNAFKGATYMPDEHNGHVQAYYDSIAALFNEWGIGYVKVDGCGPNKDIQHPAPDTRKDLDMMHKAFARYHIWMELSWYLDPKYMDDWAALANGARVYTDIESYSARTMTSSHRVFQRMAPASMWTRLPQGFYVDLDVVLVGMTVEGRGCIDGLDNDDIRISYISFWALVSSVFCIGSDPRRIPDKYLSLLNHPAILEIHQSGIMAQPVGSGNAWVNRKQVWWKRLSAHRLCVGLFNAHVYPFMLGISHEVKVSFDSLGITEADIKDAWTGKHLGTFTGSFAAMLRPGQCQILLLTTR